MQVEQCTGAPAAAGRATRRLTVVLLAAAIAAGGCASVGASGPEALREDARAALERDDPEAAFARLKQLATEHPDAPETRDVFVDACELSKKLYYRHRITDLRSPYVTTELDFMFGWLARYFGGGAFPEVEANTLFGGFPGDVFQRFQAYAPTDPRYAGWTFRMEDDNGVIYSVSGRREGAGPSR